MTATHCHLDDYPETLRLLIVVVGNRADAAALGFEATEQGAHIDWDALERDRLSPSERAVVRIAHGLQTFEWSGGAGPVTRLVLAAVTAVLIGDRS